MQWHLISAMAGRHGTANSPSVESEELVAEGQTIRLAPDEWVGRAFPLARYMDGGERLKSGEWAVMAYRNTGRSASTFIEI